MDAEEQWELNVAPKQKSVYKESKLLENLLQAAKFSDSVWNVLLHGSYYIPWLHSEYYLHIGF